MCRQTRTTLIILVLLVVAGAGRTEMAPADYSNIGLVSAPGNGAYHASIEGVTADGTRMFFTTAESLLAADADGGRIDIYEWTDGSLALVSAGGSGAHDAVFPYGGASSDGTRVFFETTESLVPSDTDGGWLDVYERSGGATALISTEGACGSPSTASNQGIPAFGACPSGGYIARYVGASDDGTRVFFSTAETLDPADADGGYGDVYERSGSVTTLISAGGNGPHHAGVSFWGVSADGARVHFETTESLSPADIDGGKVDVYERFGGVTTLVSAGTNGANAGFVEASRDGLRVFFVTTDSLVGTDTDGGKGDVYERAGGTTTLISEGTNVLDVTEWGSSADGAKYFFKTRESLVEADVDGGHSDLYERSGGVTKLVSAGGNGPHDVREPSGADPPFRGASADGTRVFFEAEESLAPSDTDGRWDVYERSGGVTKLVSACGASSTCPSGDGHDAFFGGASSDGTRVFFETTESLVTSDTDGGYPDVYERSGGVTRLVSVGGNGHDNASLGRTQLTAPTAFPGVFFQSVEPLVGADTDGRYQDVYVATVAKVGFAVASSTVAEGAPTVGLTVRLEQRAPGPVSVSYKVGGGSASPADFALASHRLTFAPGQTVRRIVVRLKQDFLVEPGETVVVKLFGPKGANGGRFRHTLTITDDEPRLKCAGKDATVVGTNGANVLNGTAGADVIVGRGGNDTLNGKSGNDVLCGSGGNDAFRGGNGNDTLRGAGGRDALRGQRGKDRLSGGPGNGDACDGGSGVDALLPNAGCETVVGVP